MGNAFRIETMNSVIPFLDFSSKCCPQVIVPFQNIMYVQKLR